MTDTTPAPVDPSDPNGDGSTPTKASFFKRAKKAFGAAGVAFVGLVASFCPAIFTDLGQQLAHTTPPPDWTGLIFTDLGFLIPTVGGAFLATWKLTNAKVDGTANTDSAPPTVG